MQFADHNHHSELANDVLICRCLKVRLSTIADAIEVCGLNSIRDIRCATGAGDGCTACHIRIRQLLHQRAVERDAAMLVP